MDEVKDMIRGVINGQQALKRELLEEISQLRKEFNNLSTETKNGFTEINERLDKQGRQLAFLEDDAPTREEHDKLEKRVEKIEKRLKN